MYRTNNKNPINILLALTLAFTFGVPETSHAWGKKKKVKKITEPQVKRAEPAVPQAKAAEEVKIKTEFGDNEVAVNATNGGVTKIEPGSLKHLKSGSTQMDLTTTTPDGSITTNRVHFSRRTGTKDYKMHIDLDPGDPRFPTRLSVTENFNASGQKVAVERDLAITSDNKPSLENLYVKMEGTRFGRKPEVRISAKPLNGGLADGTPTTFLELSFGKGKGPKGSTFESLLESDTKYVVNLPEGMGVIKQYDIIFTKNGPELVVISENGSNQLRSTLNIEELAQAHDRRVNLPADRMHEVDIPRLSGFSLAENHPRVFEVENLVAPNVSTSTVPVASAPTIPPPRNGSVLFDIDDTGAAIAREASVTPPTSVGGQSTQQSYQGWQTPNFTGGTN